MLCSIDQFIVPHYYVPEIGTYALRLQRSFGQFVLTVLELGDVNIAVGCTW